MSVQEKLQDTDEFRQDVEQVRADFDEFADRFRADVAEKGDVSAHLNRFAETDRRFEDARGAFVGYVEAFEADVATKVDTSDFNAEVSALSAEIADRRAAFDAYRETFAADAATKAEASDLAAAIRTFREEVAAHGDNTRAYTDHFAADVDRLRAEATDYGEAFGAYTADFLGEDLYETVRPRSDAAAEAQAGTEPDPAEPTDETVSETETAGEMEPSEIVSTETDDGTTDAEPGDSAGGTDRTGEAGDDSIEVEIGADSSTGSDAGDTSDAEAESMEEIAQAQDQAENGDDFTEELSEVPYGTLKKAANALGYEDDLNSATKSELIDFFSGKEIDELRSALDQ